MFSTPLEHIHYLYKIRAKNDENSSTLAQTLEANILTSFKGEHKFIFELLQNADDSGANEDPITVEISELIISSNGVKYIVFSHTGLHFTEQDVEKLCDNGQQYFKEKSLNENKIGYKNVGFKSIFSIAGCVHVMSRGYHFRFDQNYFQQSKKERGSFPWPIIPIPSTLADLPVELHSILKRDQVNFILQIRPETNVADEINFIKDNKELFLFLRRVCTISLNDCTGKTEIRMMRPNNCHKQIFVNGKFVESWVIQDYVLDIPPAIQRSLNTLQDSECPQRLKAAKKTRITLAAKVNERNEIIPNRSSQVFCYLPTQVNFGFPFIANGDFLLNTDRTRLIDNDWNAFLFDLIGYYQLLFLAYLSPIYNSKEIQTLKLLPERVIFNLNVAIEKSYYEGLARGTREVAFIPSLRNVSKLVKAPEVIIDSTGFFEGFNKFDFDDGFLVSNSKIVQDKFLPLFQSNIKRKINYSYLWQYLETFVRKHGDLETQHYVLTFLKRLLEKRAIDSLSLLASLKERKFILSEKGTPSCPQDLYILTEAMVETSLTKQLELIHPALTTYSDILSKIGVRKASRIEFIRRFIKDDILKRKITPTTVMPVTQLVFMAMRSKVLEERDWDYLRELPIKTKLGNLKPAFTCYLSDVYQPLRCLETILPNADIFVSSEYANLFDQLDKWRQFFIQLGVKEDVKIQFVRTMSTNQAFETKHHMRAYLKHVESQGYGHLSSHPIHNFMDIDLLEYASIPSFSSIFWEVLLNHWSLIKNFGKSKYETNKYSHTIETSYLQFCIRQFVEVATTGGERLPIQQVFTPTLLPIIGEFLAVADIERVMTEEQAEFFGFKTKITVKECLKILDNISTTDSRKDIRRYPEILKYLLKIELTESDKCELKKWQGKLLSQNNTFQPISNLQYLSGSDLQAPLNEFWLKPLPFVSASDMVKMATLFGVAIVGSESTHVISEGNNQQNSELARTQVLEKLPIMALMMGHHKNEDPADVLGILTNKLAQLTFVSTETLKLKIGNSISFAAAYICDNTFYFEKDYCHALTRNKFCAMLVSYLELTQLAAHTIETYLYLNNWHDLETFLQREQLDVSQLPHAPKFNTENTKVSRLSPNQSAPKSEEAVMGKSDFTKEPIQNKSLPVEDNLVEHLQSLQEQFNYNIAEVEIKKTALKAKNEKIVSDSNDHKLKQFDVKDERLFFDIDASSYKDEVDDVATESSGSVDKLKTARTGERIVYERLKIYYQNKYRNCQFEENNLGFKMTGQYLNKETSQMELLNLELIWSNKGLPADRDNSVGSDFRLCKNGITRYIEVKSSNSAKKGIFSITAVEWKAMELMQNLYRIFLVKNLRLNPTIEKIRNPFALIQQGHIKIKSYNIKL